MDVSRVTVNRSRDLAPPSTGPPVPPRPSEPAFKLYYFNIRTRGELIRLIFNAANVDYDDIRVNATSWEQMKKDTPFHSLPVLEVQGRQLGQSMSIARFLATEFGMRGDDLYEQALVDSVAETVDDLLSDYLKTIIDDRSKKKLTYADLAVYNVLEQLVASGNLSWNTVHQFNYIAELRKRMLTHGSLSRYINNRPKTQI